MAGLNRPTRIITSVAMVRKVKSICVLGLLLLVNVYEAKAEIELPWLLSDGAVLQREEPVPIWGIAMPHSEVTVDFAGEIQTTLTDDQGSWRVIFSPKKAGGPYSIRVTSKEFSKSVTDIWMGDVWLCSGQSNMEWLLRNSLGADAEIQSAPFPKIRHFKVPNSWAPEPSDVLAGGQWRVATREHLGEFSGVGWYFAKQVHTATGVPIGLINATWGGSKIEAWMSPTSLGRTTEAARDALTQLVAEGELRARSIKLNLNRWPGSVVSKITEAKADWSAVTIDEIDWLHLEVPGLWETQGYAGVDGVIWYRRIFELNETQAAGDITLSLGRIDDADVTWVNGNKVGETSAYDRVRTYTVPKQFLKVGVNQIAVRVEDMAGGGGIYSDVDLIYWQAADGRRNSLAGKWKIKADRVSVSLLDNIQHTDTALYNKMLHPLLNVPIKGVLWYQGESNANSTDQAEVYRQQFPALIHDWRVRWNNPELPFYWVQLANFISKGDSPASSPWAILRESQTAALSLNNTGQAITIDVGNPLDIHPTDKKSVGERLARIALNKTYGHKKIHFRGPVFRSATIKRDHLILAFSASSRLTTRIKDAPVNGFEIAGADGQFQKVAGTLKSNKIELPLGKVTQPNTVRYAWSDNPEEANLMDSEGLPAEPFRTKL